MRCPMNIADLLQEYTPTRTQFSHILSDTTLRMGFECECLSDVQKYRNDDDDDYNDWEQPDYDTMDWHELQDAEGLEFSPEKLKRIDLDHDEWLWRARMAEWRTIKPDYIARYREAKRLG